MNGEFVILTDKKNKPKKCVVNEKNKVLYVKKNNANVKYVKHNNKFILKDEYFKLCKKKTKKMRGGVVEKYIAFIRDNKLIMVNGENIHVDLLNDVSKYININYDDNKNLYFYILNDDNSIFNDKIVIGGDMVINIWYKAIIKNLIDKSLLLLGDNNKQQIIDLLNNDFAHQSSSHEIHPKGPLMATVPSDSFDPDIILKEGLDKNSRGLLLSNNKPPEVPS